LADAMVTHRSAALPMRTSNGVRIDLPPERFAPMRDSTALAGEADELHRRFVEDGYVLLRGVLDPQAVARLRAQYFDRLFDQGGESARPGPDYGTPGHPAYELVRSAAFDVFTRDEALLSTVETLFGEPAEMIPRRIVRHFAPRSVGASRAHVDFDYLDRGTDQVITAWIPIGDCSVEGGGLIYLEGSHGAAQADLEALRPYTDRATDHRPLSNDLGRTARMLGGRWLWADFHAGDVAFHTARIVHASLDNASDSPRLSIDIRFRPRSGAHDPRWDGDWSADDGY
jgi:ectoine hydroxylase-related dioxygenase (phytanoyl-CoA dioxygenase family)